MIRIGSKHTKTVYVFEQNKDVFAKHFTEMNEEDTQHVVNGLGMMIAITALVVLLCFE
jgi:hypothetical protein